MRSSLIATQLGRLFWSMLKGIWKVCQPVKLSVVRVELVVVSKRLCWAPAAT
jgi:hypothetical protein